MFQRLVGLSSLLSVCFVGCCLSGHQDCGCGHRGKTRNSHNSCEGGGECACTAPLYPGDVNCHNNCSKHNGIRPSQRFATRIRRTAPSWMTGLHSGNCGCGSCGNAFTVHSGACQQTACGLPFCGIQPECGCDSCAVSSGPGWYGNDGFSAGPLYQTTNFGVGGCSSCGVQTFTNDSQQIPNGNWQYESVESSGMNYPGGEQNSNTSRYFAPTDPHILPKPPGSVTKPAPVPPNDSAAVPMPQDMTPMDIDAETNRKEPDFFDPMPEEGAPEADNVLDPASYEVPQLPPIPIPHRESGKRVAVPYPR